MQEPFSEKWGFSSTSQSRESSTSLHTYYEDENGFDSKHGVLSEAADIYGDAATAEEYGYVKRGLKSRHIQFIALGGTIGTGLFLGIGSAFAQAGPLSVLLGYTITGIAVWAMMNSLGEMATWLPLPGAIPQFCSRYFDDALGFAVGWNNWYASAITVCTEISAASLVIDFWHGTEHIPVALWITLLIILVISLNIFAVSIYGEAEFIFSSIKIITILGLLILAFILDLGGGPNHQRLGFQYWKNPGAMKTYDAPGNTGRFLGLFSTLINAAFSYNGVELVAVAAGEAENPRRNIPKAVKRVFWRILFFYVLGSLAIGVLVAYNDPLLLKATGPDAGNGAAQSPWVIAMVNAGIPVLPSIINAVILTSAASSANAFLYTGSRYLFALAQNRQAPRFLLRCNRAGVPVYCVAMTASISLLTYLSLGKGGPAKTFEWFQNLTTIAGLFTWCSICLSYIKFHSALRAQNIDRNTLSFKSYFQPYTAWFALIYFSIIIIFNGFNVFTSGNWNVTEFFSAYIGIPVFFGLFFAWKWFKGTKLVGTKEADLRMGKEAVDREEGHWAERVPGGWLGRVWGWLV